MFSRQSRLISTGRRFLVPQTEAQRFLALAIVAMLSHVALATRGFNWDMEMIFKIASSPAGTHFYLAFPGYANWGPLGYWAFQVFHALPMGEEIFRFRYYCSAFFSACDLCTAWVAWRLWSLKVATVFLFSPVAMVIAGYHCNAEPACLAAAALGLYFYDRACRKGTPAGGTVILYALLGVSLAFKHVFILFPLWLALRPIPWSERVRCCVISYGSWLAILSPFLISAPFAVTKNILLYSSTSGNGFIPLALWSGLDALGLDYGPSTLRPLWLPIFLSMTLGIGWLFRRCGILTLFLTYPLALVSLASALAPQYFASASLSVAAIGGPLVWIYQAMSGIVMASHFHELRLFELGGWFLDQPVEKLGYNRGLLAMQVILFVILITFLRRHWLGKGRPAEGARGHGEVELAENSERRD